MTEDKPQSSETPSLYRSILGDRYSMLPDVIQRMHDVHGIVEARGKADVIWGDSKLSRLAARLLGMPQPGTALPAHVKFIRTDLGEILRRRYGEATLETLQMRGTGTDRDLLLEAFGPITLVIRLVPSSTDLKLELHRATMFGVPMPRRLWPRLDARERADGDDYQFRVAIGLPLIGQIIEYRGTLRPVSVAHRLPSTADETTDLRSA